MSHFVSDVSVAEIGALLGDTGRVRMLSALMSGRALTASELAYHAGVTPQTASSHLGKLSEAGLLTAVKQGRHRYYRLASPQVAQALESLSALAATHGPDRYRPRSRIDAALQTARTCYDHLAGRLAVSLADSMVESGRIEWSEDGGIVTTDGQRFLNGFGIEIAAATRSKRRFCRPCIDWSERRPHIAGWVGARLADRLFDIGWIERVGDSRAVTVTHDGAIGFAEQFGLDVAAILSGDDHSRSAA